MAANRNPGGITLARFEDRPIDLGGQVGTPQGSAAGAVDQIAAQLRQFSARIGARADQMDIAEGREEGAAAGYDPEFRRQEGNSAYAQAFNAAGTQAFFDRTETEMRRQMQAAFDEAGNDPAALTERLEGLRTELEGAAVLQESPALRAQFNTMFDRARLPVERQAARNAIAAQEASDRAAVSAWLETRLTGLDRIATDAGLDEAADAALTGELTDLQASLAMHGPREAFSLNGVDYEPDASRAGSMTPEQLQRIWSTANRQVASGRIMGAFSRTSGLGAQQAFLEDFREAAAEGEGFYAALTTADINRLDTAMGRTIRRSESEVRRVRRDYERALDQALDAAVTVSDAGLPAGDGRFETIAAAADAIGAPELAQEARQAGAIADAAAWAWTQTPAALEAIIREERGRITEAGSATPFEARRLGAIETVLGHVRSGLNADPLTTAVRAGVVDLPPLDTSSDEALAASLNDRVSRSAAVAEHYGLTAAPVFTREERLALSDRIAAGETDQLATSRLLVEALGPEDGRRALAELAPDAPMLAHMGALVATGADQAAADMARGRALADVDGFESPVPTPATIIDGARSFGEWRAREMGGFAQMFPETAAHAGEAADAIYTARASRRGLDRDRFDPVLYRRAMNEALGAVYVSDGRREVQYGGLTQVRRNGRYQLPAPNWLQADRLDDVLGGIGDADLAALPARPVDGRGNPIDAATLRRSAWYLPAGDGQYFIGFGNREAERPQLVTGADGMPYRLDLNALYPAIAARHGEWVR